MFLICKRLIKILKHKKFEFDGIFYVKGLSKKKNNSLTIHLYGSNFEDKIKNPVLLYHGSFKPEELPGKMEGNFGVVWDGVWADTCEGNTGQYLKYNNPHKVSLYLASGLPVIIWDQAALADFILRNRVGITVSNLDEIWERLNALSAEEYRTMCTNAEKIGEKIRNGYYFYHALDTAFDKLHML